MVTIVATADSPDERRVARAWFGEAAEVSYPDLGALGRISRRERLDALFEAHWHHPERLLWFARTAQGIPVGLVWVQPSHHAVSDLPDWLVVCLAVSAEHRARGVGRSLMQHVRAQAEQHGVGRLRLYVASDNTPAGRLYAALGFKPGVIEMACVLEPT
jgi:ribosomal protein S18 acetylase RimI-like enzyme